MTSACLINLLPKEILLNTCHLKPINFQNIMICELQFSSPLFNVAIYNRVHFLLQYPKLSRVFFKKPIFLVHSYQHIDIKISVMAPFLLKVH